MANKRRGAAPGAYIDRGVECTMDSPMGKQVRVEGNGGEYGRNHAPFDQPQNTGNGGIPTKFYDGMRATPAKTLNAGQASPIGVKVNPQVGNRRFGK